MANPDPKALQAAAAAMSEQARAARQAMLGQRSAQALDIEKAQEDALVQKHAAEQLVKDRETLKTHYEKTTAAYRKTIDEDQKKLAEAESKGDTHRAQEIREDLAYTQADLTTEQSRLDETGHLLDDARVAVAERTRDLNDVHQQMHQLGDKFDTAEKQLDALEDKAQKLGEAGRKLELAGTLDDPVERANTEADAEKLLKDANAIQVDPSGISAVTGQDLTLPDVGSLPAQAAPTDTATNDTTPGDTPVADATPVAPDSPSTTPSSDGGDTATTSSSGHLDDQFAVLTASDGGTTPAGATADPVSGDGSGGAAVAAAADVAPADAAPAVAAPADDVLGVGSGDPAAGTSFDTPQPADDSVGVADGTPTADPGVTTFDAPADASFDATPAPADDAAAAAPDPGDDFSSVASVDTASTGDDSDA